MLDGNEIQTQRIARDLFEQWKQEQERQRKPLSMSTITSIVALAMSLGTMIWQGAITTQRVDENVRRLDKIEAFGIDRNFARLESKVDLLLEDRQNEMRKGTR